MVKMNTGRWRWSEFTPYPLWDPVQKCPLWSAEEWKAVRTALLKPVDVELTRDKVIVPWNTGTKATNEDDDDTGTKILIAPVIQGRGVPATFIDGFMINETITYCGVPVWHHSTRWWCAVA